MGKTLAGDRYARQVRGGLDTARKVGARFPWWIGQMTTSTTLESSHPPEHLKYFPKSASMQQQHVQGVLNERGVCLTVSWLLGLVGKGRGRAWLNRAKGFLMVW